MVLANDRRVDALSLEQLDHPRVGQVQFSNWSLPTLAEHSLSAKRQWHLQSFAFVEDLVELGISSFLTRKATGFSPFCRGAKRLSSHQWRFLVGLVLMLAA
jgi:hypothetical protein